MGLRGTTLELPLQRGCELIISDRLPCHFPQENKPLVPVLQPNSNLGYYKQFNFPQWLHLDMVFITLLWNSYGSIAAHWWQRVFPTFVCLSETEKASSRQTDRHTLQKSSASLDTLHREGYYFCIGSSSSFLTVLSAPWAQATLKKPLVSGVDTRHSYTPRATDDFHIQPQCLLGVAGLHANYTALSAALALGGVGWAIKLFSLITVCIFGNWVESFAMLHLVTYFLQTVSPSSAATFWLRLLKQLTIYEAFWWFTQRIWKSKVSRDLLWTTVLPKREDTLLCIVGKFINNAEHYIHLAGKRDLASWRGFCSCHETQETTPSQLVCGAACAMCN